MGKASDSILDRYRSQARLHAGRPNYTDSNEEPTLPFHRSNPEINNNPGGLDEKDVRGGSPPRSTATTQRDGGRLGASGGGDGGARDLSVVPEASTRNTTADVTSNTTPPPAPPPDKSEDAGAGDSAVTSSQNGEKPPMTNRMVAGSKRFVTHTKDALTYSWVNVLLVFVPVGIVVEAIGASPTIIFAMNAIAIIPLAGLLSHATESVAARMGDTLGALLNVSFGNAVELIIFIIALVKGEIRIVQASLLGSILANLLLILGMSFLFGGLRFREQIYNSTVTQMSACLLSLSVTSLLLPTAFHAAFNTNNATQADNAVLKVSRGTSVILLLVYVLYLLFQLKSHAYMYESTPQAIIDEESHPGVLHDILNSSSSDDSSSSDSSDSDTSGSGSIITTGKKIGKKMFKARRRRKSTASASSTTTSSVVHSALSSPSTTERQGSYWDAPVNNQQHRESALGAIASGDEGDAEAENGTRNIMPRIRDFVQGNENATQGADDNKSTHRKKYKRKHHKKHHKKHHHHDEEKEAATQQEMVQERSAADGPQQPRVGFVEDMPVVSEPEQMSGTMPAVGQSPGKTAFNMRQLSSRATFRPALPKYLSNTVFTTPPPPVEPIRRQATPARTRSTGLRRASSLPEMNRQPNSGTANPSTSFNSRTEPLPPFQHQGRYIHKVKSDHMEDAEDEGEPKHDMSRTAAVILLLISTGLVAACAEFMVDAIPLMLASQNAVGQAFIGLIILPIVGNAAEHVTAVTVATKNKMDLAIGVAVGSSIQIALFVTPIVVLLGWILHTDMSLYFNIFETVSLFVTAFVVNFLILDGRSNYLEGSLLIAAYVIIAVGAFFYPGTCAQSAVGGGNGGSECQA